MHQTNYTAVLETYGVIISSFQIWAVGKPLGGPQVFILGVNSYLDFDHNILEILLSRGPSQVITAGGSRFTLFFKH